MRARRLIGGLVGLGLVAAACASEPSVPGISGTSAPGTSRPGTSAPGTSVPGTSVPGTSVPGTSAPGTSAPGTSATGTSVPGTSATAGRDWIALTPGTSWQWQIDGETIDESILDDVANPKKMFDVDLFATDAATISRLQTKGIVVVCYMETGGWESYRPDAASYPEAVLGEQVDGYPDERFVDIRQLDVLMPILRSRLDLAASKGCDGIEPDLDDTYASDDTGFPLSQADQLVFNRAVADAAHQRGMSIGLKNGATADGSFERAMVEFTDWALNEECNVYDECAGYAVYIAAGKAVFQVEYTKPNGTGLDDFCPADNAADFDGILKESSDSLGALPRTACRFE